MTRPSLAVLAVVARNDCVLLVRRANEPDAGLWGFPGGRVEPGERLGVAAERELSEETGVSATAHGFLDHFEVIEHDDDGALAFHYVMMAMACDYVAGTPVAADDALEARWVPLDEVLTGALPMSAGVGRLALRALDLLPAT